MSRLTRTQLMTAALFGFGLLPIATSFSADSATQDRAAGNALFEKRCGGCHALDRDKEGPRLGGVYGRTAGSIDSFAYSEALRKSGIRWNEVTLDQWLIDAEKLVPGNDMAFRVEKAEERRAI